MVVETEGARASERTAPAGGRGRPVAGRAGPARPSSPTGSSRILDVLEALSSAQRPVALSELAQRLRLPKSTVHRLLATLKQAQYVQQNPETERYEVGIKALRLGVLALQNSSLVQVAHPLMERLARQVGETAQLGVLDDAKILPLHRVESDVHAIRAAIPRTAYTPLHATAAGKVLLAGLSGAELDALLDRLDLQGFTPHTITDRAALRREVDEVRARGYSTDREEHNLGVCCVAVPIRNVHQRVIASLSVTAPAGRLPAERSPELATLLRAAAEEIAARLAVPPAP